MNVHEPQRPEPVAPEAIHRYEPAPRQEHPERGAAFDRLWALATSPILGSRLFFPRSFDEAVERLLRDPAAARVIPEHALWYFGAALHLEVDPARLQRRISDYVQSDRGARWMGTSFLDAADWSDVLDPIDRSPIHREMCEIVAAGNDFRDTRAYRNLIRAIEVNLPSKRNGVRLVNVESIEAYFRYCRDLIKSMRKRGAVRHRAAGAFHRLRVKHRDSRSVVFDSSERDIGVAIAADGELIRHLGGKHRTAIAQALELPQIPVEVRLVHVRWLAREMCRTGLPAHLALSEGIRGLSDIRGEGA